MRRTRALLMAGLTCVLGLGGCASEGEEPASPESGPTSSEPTPAEEHEESAEKDHIPGVEPAEGPLVTMQTVTYRVPGGLETYEHSPRMSGATDADAETWLDVTDLRITAGWDLDRQAREHRKALATGRTRFERGPDVETPVCTMFTFSGMESGDRFFAEAGCEVAGTSLTIKATQDQGRRGIVERILYPTLESMELR